MTDRYFVDIHADAYVSAMVVGPQVRIGVMLVGQERDDSWWWEHPDIEVEFVASAPVAEVAMDGLNVGPCVVGELVGGPADLLGRSCGLRPSAASKTIVQLPDADEMCFVEFDVSLSAQMRRELAHTQDNPRSADLGFLCLAHSLDDWDGDEPNTLSVIVSVLAIAERGDWHLELTYPYYELSGDLPFDEDGNPGKWGVEVAIDPGREFGCRHDPCFGHGSDHSSNLGA